MNRHQEYLFELLREIDSLCRANDIVYYLGMGSLIGAVRSRGFLPWDDDADIMMTADNFDKFKELSKTDSFPSNRFLGAPDLEESYCHILPRYVSRDTTAIHTCQSLTDDVAGELIDIFVLDPIADGQEAYDKYVQDMALFSSIVNYANASATRFELDPGLYLEYCRIEHEQGAAEARHLLEERLESNFSEQGNRYAFRWQGVPLTFERAWFDGYSTVTFEGHEFMAPADINGFLTCYYGEEWPEVPGNIAPSKHNAAFSCDFPYTEALEFYTPPFDRDELHAKMDERKLALLRHAKVDNALVDERTRAKTAVVEADLHKVIGENQELYERAVQERDGKALAELLKGYLSWQTSRYMIGRHATNAMRRYMHPMLVDVDDGVFEAGLLALFCTERIRHASRLLQVRRDAGLPSTPGIQGFSSALDKLHAIMGDFERSDYDDGIRLAEGLVAAFPQVRYFRSLLLAHLLGSYRKTKDAETLDRVQEETRRALAFWPQEGAFLKFRADCLAEAGRAEEADEAYVQAAEHTRDGFALLEIAERTGYYPSWMRNPAWAREAGIPQWEGPAPKPLESEPSGALTCDAQLDLEDPRKETLFSLLSELAGICAEHDIDYVLCPAAAQAFFAANELPGREDAYTLWMELGDYAKLMDILWRELPPNRELEYLATRPSLKNLWLRYHAKESIRLPLKGKRLPKFPSVCVTVKPLEPLEYRIELERLFSQLRKGHGTAFVPQGKRARLYAKVHRIGKTRADAAGDIFRLMLRTENPSRSGYLRDSGKAEEVDLSFLRATEKREFRHFWFEVPVELCEYVGTYLEDDNPTGLQIPDTLLFSGAIGYDELVATGALSEDYFERKRAASEANAPYRETIAAFRENFRQIKEAVRKKQREVGGA